MRKTSAAMTAAAATIAAALTVPAVAPAATVTVTGDTGAPVALNPAAPTGIRNVHPDLAVALAANEKSFSLSVAGPVGAAATPRTCATTNLPSWAMDYQGNGTYTVAVTTYTDVSCKVGATPASYAVAINAGVALTAPAGRVLTRQPNSFTTNTLQIPVALNPGALTHELHVAQGGALAPDGSISGPSTQVFADTTTGTAPVRLTTPGKYVMVGRATGYTGAAGQFFSPWSAPITFRALAPFDLSGKPLFPDSRGPSYKMRVQLREKAARGKVTIKMARGKGRFRSIGKAKINRRGVFKKGFTQHRTGTYSIRFIYKGSKKVAPGKVTLRGYSISRRSL